MELEEFNNITKSILENCNNESIDVGAISENLSQLNSAFEELTTNSKDISEKNIELNKTNESLRSVNMKLFTQIGIVNNEGKDEQENDNQEEQQEETKTDIKDLFDEHGNFI